MDASKDYYAVLGVLTTAEDVVIRAAYRALAQRFHPDRQKDMPGEATVRMADINEAYRILSDPALREQYDAARRHSGAAPSSFDSAISFEAEQYRSFAEKLHEWGYGEASIYEALIARGVRPPVAAHLAAALGGKSR